MGFYDIANAPLIYVMVIIAIATICGMCVVFLGKCWKRATQLGYSREQLSKVVKSSITISIVPSIATVVGFFAIAAMMGIPWPWWRLSVIGAVQYETTAANIALAAAGVDLASAGAKDFVLVMWCMTIGIAGGVVLPPFITRGLHMGSTAIKQKDNRWGTLGISMFMVAIVIALAEPILFDANRVKTMVLLTSVVVGWALRFISNKFKINWLKEFILAFAMIISMASSLLWTAIL